MGHSPKRSLKRTHVPSSSDLDVIDLSDEDEPKSPSLLPSGSEAGPNDAGKRWPADYPVNDIVRFFGDCGDHPKEKLSSVFQRHFPNVPFPRSTYYDNLKRWKTAKQVVRNGAMGKKWSVFVAKARKK